MTRFSSRFTVLLAAGFATSACASTVDKIKHIGEPPQLSPIAVPPGIVGGQPVLVPQPFLDPQPNQANSPVVCGSWVSISMPIGPSTLIRSPLSLR